MKLKLIKFEIYNKWMKLIFSNHGSWESDRNVLFFNFSLKFLIAKMFGFGIGMIQSNLAIGILLLKLMVFDL